jgi:hypothetical protein
VLARLWLEELPSNMKSRAMDIFERLLLMGSREAQQALSDWDRR